MIAVGSGFLLGLVGSLHCVGMCGPIVLALPLTSRDRINIVSQMLLYNVGRVFTYSLLGFFFGLLGWGLSFGNFQKTFSIVLGVILLVAPFRHRLSTSSLASLLTGNRLARYVSKKMQTFIHQTSNGSTFKFGILNGALPCGLVYTALASSTLLPSPSLGAQYMGLFGLGTIPLMLLVMIGGYRFRSFSKRMRALSPILAGAYGIYLIYRGMTMSIPSEPMDIVMGLTGVMCH